MSLLPTTKNVPKMDFDQQTKIIHGVTGVGKSSLFDLDEMMVISNEGRCDHLSSAMKVEVTTWREFEAVCDELDKTAPKLRGVSIDKVSNLWQMASDEYCKVKMIKSLLDEKWAPGYAVCETVIYRRLIQLRKRYPLALIAHSVYDDTPVDGPNGTPVIKVKWIPDAYKKLHAIIKGLAYFEGYMEMSKGKRVIHCNPSDLWEAKACLPMGSAKMPDTIEIPDGQSGYSILKDAYNTALAARPLNAQG